VRADVEDVDLFRQEVLLDRLLQREAAVVAARTTRRAAT